MSQPEFEYLGPYKVESTLGRGGMGTVYKGIHARSGEAVAIKVIATGVANQSRFRRRFAAEVETLKRLKHPNIVTLVGYGEEQGLLFYSMEYVDGKTLHEHLRNHRQLPWEDVLEIGIQTTGALKHAHDLGIIHRDLKPANLMLNPEGQVKLTDFGIAKLFGSTDMTAAGSVIGTADYMPPEQAEGRGVTVRSDLYSLGGVLYALLAGKAPFGGKSVPEVLYAVRYNPVPNLQSRAEDAPAELCELIHQLLEKDPQKRPPTALVVRNRMKAIQLGMKKAQEKSQESEDDERKTAVEPIGPQLTSLDLSDVEDEELKLTGEEDSKIGSDPSSDVDTHVSRDLGTHDQQTMLAPNVGDDGLPAAPLPEKKESDQPADENEDGAADVPNSAEGDFSHVGQENEEFVSDPGSISTGGPSHFTPIGEEEDKPYSFAVESSETQEATDWIQYISIAGMVALLIGSIGFGWWMLQPRKANEIYVSIMAAAESGDDAEILSAKGDIEEFLERFPEDERKAEVQVLQDDLELTRWTRILQRRASRQGGTNELSAIEQGFLDCMLSRGTDADGGQKKLTAFIAVFGPLNNLTRDEKRLVELAQFASTLGAQLDTEDSLAATQLADLIRAAEESLDGEKLKNYYRQLILLYKDKPWSAEQLRRLQVALDGEQ